MSRSLADSEPDSVTGRLIMKKRRETDVSVCKNDTRALPRPCLPRSAHWERSSRLLFRGVSILLSIRWLVVSDELIVFVCCPRRPTEMGILGRSEARVRFVVPSESVFPFGWFKEPLCHFNFTHPPLPVQIPMKLR